jgi:hypothetical protein
MSLESVIEPSLTTCVPLYKSFTYPQLPSLLTDKMGMSKDSLSTDENICVRTGGVSQ